MYPVNPERHFDFDQSSDDGNEEVPEVSAQDLFGTIAEALTELFARVDALEKRPTFAASIKGRSR